MAVAVLMLAAQSVRAQTLDPRLTPPADSTAVTPELALLGSAILPGAGQYMLGSDRWVPYLVLETWAWLSFLDRRREARSIAGDYRDLAWFVARRVSTGERRDTVFDYYETMSHFSASGSLDSDPRSPGIQPEIDPATFNGDLWGLARSLFLPGGADQPPGTVPYQRALAYYLTRAIPPSFAWAWGDSNLEQQSFRELIRLSDESYRTSTQVLGLILVNHLVSAVDALVLGRLGRNSGESRLRVGSRLDQPAIGPARLQIQATIRW